MAVVVGTLGDDIILPGSSSAGVTGVVTNNADTILGSRGSDTIDGGGGDDSIIMDGGVTACSLSGGAGDDTIFGRGANDTIDGGAGADLIDLNFTAGLSTTVRLTSNDIITVSGGANVVLRVTAPDITGTSFSGTGTDDALNILTTDTVLLPGSFGSWGIEGLFTLNGTRLRATEGDDSFDLSSMTRFVAETWEVILEARGGNDTITTTAVRPLTLDGGTGDDSLTGLSNPDRLLGGSGADTLNGGTNADTMEGGGGNDLYLVDNLGDRVIEAGPGADTVRASADHALSIGVEVLVLEGAARSGTGNASANRIIGTGGDDLLNGRVGADTMEGGLGNDRYFVDSAGDLLVDAGGVDLVFATVSFTLGAGIEQLVLVGNAGLSGTGNALANRLTGNAGANSLRGLDGDDILDGRAGADTMDGGLGNDRFYIDSAGDILLDAGGVEVVYASLNHTLAAGFEQLMLLGSAGLAGTGNTLGNRITGNGGANSLSGLGGNDVLDGEAGADTMDGGLGSDIFYVDSAGDVILDAGGNELVFAAVNWTLAAGLERLTLLGGAEAGAGNAAANRITGNAGADSLHGGAGADTLAGEAANDVLTGGADADLFLRMTRAEGVDRIVDFAPGTDRFGFGAAAFGLPAGPLPAANFAQVAITPTATAPSGTPQFLLVHDIDIIGRAEQAIWFDPDGVGAQAAELLCQLDPSFSPLVSVGDILLV